MTKKLTRAKAIWQKMSFWGRVERSLGLLGGSAILLESVFGAGPVATGITALFTVASQNLAVWFDDKNQDGIADIYQSEEELGGSPFTDNQE